MFLEDGYLKSLPFIAFFKKKNTNKELFHNNYYDLYLLKFFDSVFGHEELMEIAMTTYFL